VCVSFYLHVDLFFSGAFHTDSLKASIYIHKRACQTLGAESVAAATSSEGSAAACARSAAAASIKRDEGESGRR